MTTLELFKKHRKGEVSRERFLYEVRRDNNLPWITNVTSYNDAVKILKNKGIIRESMSNVPLDPAADHVNPYFLKRGVNKILDGEKELTNDSYINAVNKASRQLKANPHAFDKEMFANADEVAKADSKLETKEVKKGNHIDKDNGMKKVKGQETLKAQSAPTKENRKGKPKGVKVMPDKGVTGTQKIMKEISEFIKKKLNENSDYSGFHEGKEVETREGTGVIKAINGSTLEVELKESGKLMDVQMSEVNHYEKKKQEEAEQQEAIDVRALGGHEGGMELANKLIDAIKMYNDLNPDQKQAEIERLKSNIPAELRAKFDQLMDALHDERNYPHRPEEGDYLEEGNAPIREASSLNGIIDALEEAQDHLRSGVDALEEARRMMASSEDRQLLNVAERIKYYMLGHIEPLIDSEHQWATNDESIQDIIDDLESNDKEEIDELVSDEEVDAAVRTGEVLNVPLSNRADIERLKRKKASYSTYKG